MSAFTAFIKKEFLGLFRSGKAVILLLISVLFGIMNPAIAKLTPWMMESMADSMAETGLVVTAVEVDAMTSWTQFYKNAPMALIVFLLMFAGILTSEYQSGTLIGMVTKGISRWKILAAKKIMVLIVWTVFFWLMYGITFGYNQYFWDQSKIEHPLFAAGCFYILGVWLVSLIFLSSVLARTNTAVLGMTGGVFLISSLLGMYHGISKYLPTELLGVTNVLTKSAEIKDYQASLIVITFLILIQTIAAVTGFNKKAL